MFDSSTVLQESDPYMSPIQREYFREKLLTIKSQLEQSIQKSLMTMNGVDSMPIEEVERSALAMDRDIELQTQARNWDMIHRINQAIERINDGSYGYCQETDEPIGIKRLEASPTALFCLAVQEDHEIAGKRLNQKTY